MITLITREVDVIGNIRYFNIDGFYHRPNGPAMLWWDGDWTWCLNGERHRYYGASSPSGRWYVHGDIMVWG